MQMKGSGMMCSRWLALLQRAKWRMRRRRAPVLCEQESGLRYEVDGVDGCVVLDDEGGRGEESQLPVREYRNNSAVQRAFSVGLLFCVCSYTFCMDLDSVLQRIKSFPGVVGHVIVDSKRNVVHTSLEKEEAISLAAVTIKEYGFFKILIMQLIEVGNESIQELGDVLSSLLNESQSDADFIRIRSKKRDILIVPGKI